MLRIVFALGLAIATAPAHGAADGVERLEIDLSNFKFAPATITLKHGQAYVLHFENRGGGSHSFAAPAFFGAAKVAPEDGKRVVKGIVELGGGESADVHLIAPAPGRYKVHCSHFLHSTMGMTGVIVVQ